MAKKSLKKDDKGCWEKGNCEEPDHFGPLFRMPNKGQFKFSMWYFIAALLVMMIFKSLYQPVPDSLIGFSDFKKK